MSALAVNCHFYSLMVTCSNMICLLQWFQFLISSLALPYRWQGTGSSLTAKPHSTSFCVSEFQKSQSAADALEVINGWTVKGSKLRSRNALASGHLWRWIWQMNHSKRKEAGNILYEKMQQLSASVSLRLWWWLLQLVRRFWPRNQEW